MPYLTYLFNVFLLNNIINLLKCQIFMLRIIIKQISIHPNKKYFLKPFHRSNYIILILASSILNIKYQKFSNEIN